MKPNPADVARRRVRRILERQALKCPERRKLIESIEVLKEAERRAKRVALFDDV